MPRFAISMRSLLAAVAALALTGIVPAMASFDSCAMKPCCMQEQAIAAAAQHACCNDTPGSMTPARPAALTQRTSLREGPAVTAPATPSATPAAAHGHVRHQPVPQSPSPPPETFSVLLI